MRGPAFFAYADNYLIDVNDGRSTEMGVPGLGPIYPVHWS
jgi:hypothetical protein